MKYEIYQIIIPNPDMKIILSIFTLNGGNITTVLAPRSKGSSHLLTVCLALIIFPLEVYLLIKVLMWTYQLVKFKNPLSQLFALESLLVDLWT